MSLCNAKVTTIRRIVVFGYDSQFQFIAVRYPDFSVLVPQTISQVSSYSTRQLILLPSLVTPEQRVVRVLGFNPPDNC